MALSPAQIRAATALLNMTQKDLSDATGITRANLSKFDKGQTTFRTDTMARLIDFFENNNIQFTKNNGAEFKPKQDIVKLYGEQGFNALMNDVYEEMRQRNGGEICVSNVNERHWYRWMGEENYKAHAQRMKPIPNMHFKIFVEEGDDFFIASEIAEYRYIPSQFFNEQSFYVYGDKLALIAFEEENVHVKIIHSAGWAQSFRRLFNYAWAHTPQIRGE